MIQKPILLIKIAGYRWSDIIAVFIPCLKVTVVSSIIPILTYYYGSMMINNQIIVLLGQTVVSVASVGVTSWYLGIDKSMRVKLIQIVKSKILRK